MFSLLNSDFSEEIYLYVKNGGKITELPPQKNRVRLSVNVKNPEGNKDEIYFNELNSFFHTVFGAE